MPNVICVDNAIEQFKCLGIDRPLVTTDTGHCSERNLCELCRRNMKFLTLVGTDVKMARTAVDTLREALESMGAACPFDCHVPGAMMTAMHEFSFRGQRSRNGIAAGEIEKFSRRLSICMPSSQANWRTSTNSPSAGSSWS